jgi:phospholipid/cholesterol/gamma-HCH transport system substrate-binding protein
MNISKEVRTGLLVTVAVVVFFTGFYFLKGSSLFSSNKLYYCFYSNVDGLQNSANVQIRGMVVGHVMQTTLVGTKGVRVTIQVAKNIPLLTGTKAALVQSDLLGTKVIRLDQGQGPNEIESGSELVATTEGGVVESLSGELTPRLRELKTTIALLNHTLNNVNAIVGEQNQQAMTAAITNIKTTSENLAKLTGTINSESGQMTSILRNANSVTGNLAKQNDTIQHILSNVNSLSRQLANAPLQKTLNELHDASAQMKTLMHKINSSDGTLGLLVNDKQLYNSMNSSMQSLNALMADLKTHPSRYINIYVFGKSK